MDVKEMAKYIDREDLVEWLKRIPLKDLSDGRGLCRVIMEDDFKKAIKKIPKGIIADVAPVRHGRWLNKKEWHLGRWVAWLECSCCGEHDDNAEMYEMLPFGAGPSNYCPNCGAKMDGELNE